LKLKKLNQKEKKKQYLELLVDPPDDDARDALLPLILPRATGLIPAPPLSRISASIMASGEPILRQFKRRCRNINENTKRIISRGYTGQ
jgi:hypothetical protein